MKSFSTWSNNISTSEQFHSITLTVASLVAESVKNLPAVQETRVQSLGWEDPLGKVIASHSSILAWKISWTEEPGGLQSMGSQRVGHNWATNTYSFTRICAIFVNKSYFYQHFNNHQDLLLFCLWVVNVVLCLVTQSCLTLCEHVDCGLLALSMGILQARILE